MSLKLMYITNDLDIALIAQKYGVDRIWIDLETIDKEERQRGLDTVKSNHSIEDIKRLRPYLTSSELLVRVNHWHSGTIEEINAVIDAGADVIMLPYWKTIDEVRSFVETVGGRCKTILLLETKEAVDCIDEVLHQGGFDEIHIGLNDLHLSYGMTFMFELLSNGLVDSLCEKISATKIPYGFGGIARLGHGDLHAEYVIMEHYRLGSTRAILSRSFCDINSIESKDEIDSLFGIEMQRLRDYEKELIDVPTDVFVSNHELVKKIVNGIVNRRQGG